MRVKSNQKVIAERVEVADTFFKRFKGLMGRKSIDDKAGMLFYGCSSIHSFFMRFTIDVVYLSKDFTVVGVETIAPWRIGRIFKGARNVLELAQGAAKDIKEGMVLEAE